MIAKAFTPSVFFHPGITLDEKMKEMNLGMKDLSAMTGIPEQTIWNITNGEASISVNIALALEKATHIPARMWLKSQHLYDDYQLSQRSSTYMNRMELFERRTSSMMVSEE